MTIPQTPSITRCPTCNARIRLLTTHARPIQCPGCGRHWVICTDAHDGEVVLLRTATPSRKERS